ncbi:hypothetical protein [Thaumasiovibrio subtropicus]|uniref:hypothetical protein n=1 Tax=Thaumasiovibrio subtropicus TaxID=1891207 RepID=UPI000B35AC97|nr:hypothetical protein [Thaumasiovibrio subtropicus]
MSQFEEFIKRLDHADDDYWADVLSDEARKIIDSAPEVLLSAVLEHYQAWPENRLEHLAYLLGEGVSELEEQLILLLQQSKYESVVSRAKEAAIELETTRKGCRANKHAAVLDKSR